MSNPMDGIEALQGMVDMAKALGAFRTELKEQGFNREESFELCKEWTRGVTSSKPEGTNEQ